MIISSLINVMSIWLNNPLYAIALFFDEIVYSLVAYSYKLFMLMTQLNLNIVYQLASPIVDRVKALIMVFILFKLAVTLISYLLKPEEATKGTSKLITNIVVAVCLLISYDFIFELGNDLSMILLGSTDESAYQILESPGNDSGLIAKFIFGSNPAVQDTENFGVYLAASTLNIFLHDINGTGVASQIYSDILGNSADSIDFSTIKNLNTEINRTVEYHWPVVSTIVGAYLIYTIVTISIQIGVRMFKLLLLQIVAPIPICSIVSDGIKGKSFSSYMKLYLSTLLDAVIRVAAMYLATAFVGTFYNLILSGNLFSTNSTITQNLVLIIVILAIYQFVKKLPDFLKQIFPGMSFESNMGGFAKTLRTIGSIGSGVGGFALGATSGAVAGGVIGMAQGAIGGATAGFRGQGVRGALENLQRVQQSARNRAEIGLGNSFLNAIGAPLGITARRQNNAQNDISKANKTIANLDKAEEKARNELAKGTLSYDGQSYSNVTSADDLYNRVISSNSDVLKYKAILNSETASDHERATAEFALRTELDNIRTNTQNTYNTAIDNTNAIKDSKLGNTASRQQARQDAENKKKEAEERLKNAGGSSS